MTYLRRLLATLSIASICTGVALGFDTGSHFDLTRSVLSERRFGNDAIRVVQLENWLTDYYAVSPTIARSRRRDFRKLHFDNLFSTAQTARYWSWFLNNIKTEIGGAAAAGDRLTAMAIIGIGLHGVQDFYTHSNWVETHPLLADGAYATETFVAAMAAGRLHDMAQIVTGRYPDRRASGQGDSPMPDHPLIHGIYEEGVNKDSHIRAGWDAAYIFAYVASHELVAAMEKWADEVRPGFWQSLGTYRADERNRKKLEFELTAARKLSMWFNFKGLDGRWKGDKSGSRMLFSLFVVKWLSKRSSIFLKKMKKGDFRQALTANLYNQDPAPPLPEMPPFVFRRRAIHVRSTLVREVLSAGPGDKRPAHHRRDFFSQISIGGQEFTGRTLREHKHLTNPWFEIGFVDEDVTAINIAVWDQNDLLSPKDRQMDINPEKQKATLDLMYSTVSGEVSGDLAGKFDSAANLFTSAGGPSDKDTALIMGYITHFALR